MPSSSATRRKKTKPAPHRKRTADRSKNRTTNDEDLDALAAAIDDDDTDGSRVSAVPVRRYGRYPFVLLSIAVAVLWQTFGSSSSSWSEVMNATFAEDEKVDRFLSWLKDKEGAYVSPAVSIASFPEYGGYGLVAVSAVSATDELFRIPSSVVTTADSVLHETEAYRRVPSFPSRLQNAVARHFPSFLVQQDVIIALHLMAQCSLGEASPMKPYLDVLPSHAVPRLDTFDEEELAALQDEDLASLGRDSYRRLLEFWDEHGHDDDHRNDERGERRPQSLVRAMVDAARTTPSVLPTDTDDTCTSFQAFQRYVSVASSRAMVLQTPRNRTRPSLQTTTSHGTKYLTPLADMANFSPHPSVSPSSASSAPFAFHHRLHDSSSSSSSSSYVAVHADRDFPPGAQIFEDYGDVDDSLYLEAHGFVPDLNPRHCAVLPGRHLGRVGVEVPEALEPTGLWDAAAALGVAPPRKDDGGGGGDLPTACVREDGGVTDERVAGYLVLSALSNGRGEDAERRRRRQAAKCVGAVEEGGDTKRIRSECLEYDGHREVLEGLVRESARRTLCGSESTEEEDVELLEAIVAEGRKRRRTGERGTYRLETALRFRIADKRILALVVGEVDGSEICLGDGER